ncbi:MAG TPA: L,D-transpeptidase family protein [Hyphomicrobiales bacterium]|nr:L,D-transpeptidase family protein [Hyphomicrobiales bacterium]
MSAITTIKLAMVGVATLVLTGCLPGGGVDISAAVKPLPAEAQVLLAKKGMTQEAPIFVRIFKEESQLEIWKEKDDGRFYHFKTYPICNWSGGLGPKVKEGDKQSPEGFYTVNAGQMNPNSQFHLSFNLGYPNTYDRVNGHTGAALMVHGDCRSAGCYAMTDALIEEIYALAREAFNGGQRAFHVHAFPFRMTKENMKRHRKDRWYGFWKTMKPGYDDFEKSRILPKVYVCSKQYLVNAEFIGGGSPEPAETCPAFRRVPVTPYDNKPIIAQTPASPAAVATSRVASNNADVTQSTGAAPATQPPAQQQPTTSILASQPVVVEPQNQTQSGSAEAAHSEPAFSDNKLYDVDHSGKSDMILPKPAGQ